LQQPASAYQCRKRECKQQRVPLACCCIARFCLCAGRTYRKFCKLHCCCTTCCLSFISLPRLVLCRILRQLNYLLLSRYSYVQAVLHPPAVLHASAYRSCCWPRTTTLNPTELPAAVSDSSVYMLCTPTCCLSSRVAVQSCAHPPAARCAGCCAWPLYRPACWTAHETAC
jgi:hypothetical protein